MKKLFLLCVSMFAVSSPAFADPSYNFEGPGPGEGRYYGAYDEDGEDAIYFLQCESSNTPFCKTLPNFTMSDGRPLEAEIDSKQDLIAAGDHINDGATNAATNAPTNLNPVTTLLGALTGEVNATNTKQNDLAAKYNDLATKYNTLLDRLEAQGLLNAS